MLPDAPDSDVSKSGHFIRQRRNLIWVSLFLIFYKAGDLHIKQLNFLGNETDIGNPIIVKFCLTVFFLYFLWRYYTACREVKGVGAFNNACDGWAIEECKIYAFKQARKNLKGKDLSVEFYGKKEGKFRFGVYGRYDPSSDHIERKYVFLSKYYYLMRFFAVVPVTFHTSSFSEYLLPYVIALLAVLELLEFGLVDWLVNTISVV